MNIKLLPLFLFCILHIFTSAQEDLTDYHPIVQKAKETSLYTANVDWKTVNSTFLELYQEENNAEQLKDALQYLINSLGDKHAQIRSSEDYALLVYYTGKMEERTRGFDSEFHSTVINDNTAKFSYKILKNKVGYLKVVAIGQGDVKEQADFIRNGLKELKNKGVDKWIVDLRFNGGGNMEPMISGLAPLIGEGMIGGSVDSKNEPRREYTIENGKFNNYGRIACEMDNLPQNVADDKVVVLLSRYTVSSGEMLAVTFKGRSNTLFIGEETGGYTTGNGFDAIGNDMYLIISQDVFMDRNGMAYSKFVDVDVKSEFITNAPISEDEQITKAIDWLLN